MSPHHAVDERRHQPGHHSVLHKEQPESDLVPPEDKPAVEGVGEGQEGEEGLDRLRVLIVQAGRGPARRPLEHLQAADRLAGQGWHCLHGRRSRPHHAHSPPLGGVVPSPVGSVERLALELLQPGNVRHFGHVERPRAGDDHVGEELLTGLRPNPPLATRRVPGVTEHLLTELDMAVQSESQNDKTLFASSKTGSLVGGVPQVLEDLLLAAVVPAPARVLEE